MFRKILATVATAAALIVAPAAVANAAPAPTPAPTELRTLAPVVTPRLVDVRFARHRTFDRLVFDFRGGVPDVESRFVRVVREDASGRRLFVPGRSLLLLRFEPARARAFPRGLHYTGGLRNVRAFRLAGDFEGVVHVAVGLRNRVGVRVFELPGRVVVDVPHSRLYRTL